MAAHTNPIRAAFLDRDGVINEELNYVHRINDFHLLPGVVEALQILHSLGYLLIVVTNQAGIAKGKYTEVEYQELKWHMLSLFSANGIELAGIYHCPHHPEGSVSSLAIECNCRKPSPGMIQCAAADHDVDLFHSILIGDKLSDIQAARAAGVGTTIIVSSGHAFSEEAKHLADQCLPDLLAAAHWIKHQTTVSRPL